MDNQSASGIGRRNFLRVAAGAVGASIVTHHSLSAASQRFPDRAIRLVVPFAAGGNNDIIARLFAKEASDILKQPIVIDNKTGAGGLIGASFVAHAEPDGYVLLLANTATLSIQPLITEQPPYDPGAFAPVSVLGTSPLILVANKDLRATSFDAVLARLRAEPNRFNYASAGDGTPMHLVMEALKAEKGLNITHVPYRGASAEITAAMAGDVQLFFDNVPSSLPFIRRGELVAIAVTGASRLRELPDVPTLSELGTRAEQWISWFGIVAPKGTPRDRVDILNKAFVAAASTPAVRERLENLGVIPWGSTSEEMASFVAKQGAEWTRVVEKAHIRN